LRRLALEKPASAKGFLMAFITALVVFLAGGPFVYFFPSVPFARPEPRAGVGLDSLLLPGQHCADTQRLGATWYYSWTPVPQPCSNGVEAVPMIWRPDDPRRDDAALPTGAYLLALNECESPAQCGASPEAAAVAWRGWERDFPERRLVGPHVSQTPEGRAWLLAWRQAYVDLYGKPPRVWALGAHCYGTLAMCQPVIADRLALAAEWTTSGNVWLTEFAVLRYNVASDAEQLSESQRYLAWVAAQPRIERYAWFIARDYGEPVAFPAGIWQTGMIDAAGDITPTGRMYRDMVAPGAR
jgi:hypothetical protein